MDVNNEAVKQLKVATATHDYEAAYGDELSFKCDENIQVLGETNNGWSLGVKFSDKKLGMFPDNFVKLVQDVKPMFLYCKALRSQTAADPGAGELSYNKNDLIKGIRPTSRSGYMKGTLLSTNERGYFAIMNVQFLTKVEADAGMAPHQQKATRENVHAEPKPIPEPRTISTVKVVAAEKKEPKDGTDHPRSSAKDVDIDKKGENAKPKPIPPPRTISTVKKTSVAAAENKEPSNVTDHPRSSAKDVDKNVYLGRFVEPPTRPFLLNKPEPRKMPPMEDGPFAQILNRTRGNNKDANKMPEINQSLHNNGLDNKHSSMSNGEKFNNNQTAMNEKDQPASQSLSIRGASGNIPTNRGRMTSIRGGRGESAMNEIDQPASHGFSTRGSSGSVANTRGQMSSARGGHGPSGMNETDQTASHGFSTRGSDGSFANTRGQTYSARGGRAGPSSTFSSRGNRGNGFGGNRGNGYNSSVNKGFGANNGFGSKPAVNNEETFGINRGGRGCYSAQLTARPPQKNSNAFDQSSNNQGFHGQSTPNQIANSTTFDSGFRGNRGGGFNNGHNGFFGRGNGHNSSGDNRVGFGDNNGCGNNRGSFRGRGESKPENKFELNKNAMGAVANNADSSGKSTGDDLKNEKPTDVRQENSSAKHDPQETEKKQDDGTAKPNNDPSDTEVPKLPATAVPKAPEVVAPVVAALTTNDGNAGLVVPITKENNGAISDIMNGPFQEYPGIVNIVNGIRTQLSSHPEWRSLKILISGDQTEDGQISMKTEGSCEYHQKL